MRPLPTGTVTFLFTDIEGSTRLLHEVGDAYAEALAEHRRVLREAFTRHGGVEVDTQGDAFFVAFARAKDAVAAAAEAQRAMAAGPIRVRMGIHTGEPIVSEEGYIGVDVHRGARIANAGHGGQVLISQTTGDLLDSAVELHDLGEHRLKDLTEAQRLYQLGNGEFPPLRTLHQTNLPVQPTPLIGREQELGEVLELLSRTRLLTLTGAGGSGKTRLALQAAAELVEDYPQGVWWVALAALRDPELVEPTIAQVVGAKDGLVEHLRSQRTLLLLDNFERVLAAAPRIAAMLAEAPEVRVLATSRERLGVGAEQEYPVPTMTPADSLALFSARARQLRPRFEPDATVAEICRRLDGLPLALELAAARVKVLRPEQILARLEHRLELLTTGARDAPERQRTLRAAIEWSYELLDGGERRLFASLAVFAGSFDLEAAEEVAEADVDTLASLVDKSLLRQTPEGRFFMLETIREYALERLDESGETDRFRRQHASWFVALAEEAAPGLTGPDQASYLERLTGDHDNMRAVLDWAAEAGEDELQLRLTGASFRFWYLRGLLGEARTRLETALATQVQAPSLRERVLFGATLIAHRQGDVAAARAYATERLEVCRELDDPARTASAFIGLGLAAELDGDYRLANDAFDEARSKAAEAGDVWTGAVATLDLSDVALLEGDLERAATLGADATRSLRGVGDRAMVAKALSNVGIVELERGELDRARSTFEEGLRLAIELDDGESLIWHLEGVAAVAALEGDLERAATMAALSETVRDETGFAPQPTQQLLLRHVRRLVDEETLRAAQARAGPMTHEEAMACVLEYLG